MSKSKRINLDIIMESDMVMTNCTIYEKNKSYDLDYLSNEEKKKYISEIEIYCRMARKQLKESEGV